MVKYTLEKDLKEQERKLQLHVQSLEQHLNQLTETEHRFKALQLQCKQLSEAQAQLEDSGKSDYFGWQMARSIDCMHELSGKLALCLLVEDGCIMDITILLHMRLGILRVLYRKIALKFVFTMLKF